MSASYALTRQDDYEDYGNDYGGHPDTSLGVTEEEEEVEDEQHVNRSLLSHKSHHDQQMKEQYESELMSNMSYCPFGFSAICLCITMTIACLILLGVGLVILIIQKRKSGQTNNDIVVLVNMNGMNLESVNKNNDSILYKLTKDKDAYFAKLIPVFPTLDMPNRYSILTGKSPVDHGIVGDYMFVEGKIVDVRNNESVFEKLREPDVKTILSLAEEYNMTTLSVSWLGSSTSDNKKRTVKHGKTNKDRVKIVLDDLEKPQRHRLIVVNLDDTGNVAKKKGYETVRKDISDAVESLASGIKAKLSWRPNVQVILVSDHGWCSNLHNDLSDVLVDVKEPYTIVSYNTSFVHLVFESATAASSACVALKNDSPEKDQFSVCSPQAVPDCSCEGTDDWKFNPKSFPANSLVMVADSEYVFYDGELPKVASGYLPSDEAMKGVFYAKGSRINDDAPPQEEIANSDIYNIIGAILKLGTIDDTGIAKSD